MTSTSRNARVAGALYLLCLFAPLRLVYIPSTLFVRGDATATAQNIVAHETLFRLGIVADLWTGTVAIFLVLALYRLFKDVNRDLAALMVILGALMVTPIYFLNTVNDAAALLLATGAEFLSVFDRTQLDALTLFFLRLHHHGVVVNEIFWGLWLVPFGLLAYRSGFLPRFLGGWLIVNGAAYVAVSATALLLPAREALLFNLALPALLGELAMMLWLLIKGVKVKAVPAPGA